MSAEKRLRTEDKVVMKDFVKLSSASAPASSISPSSSPSPATWSSTQGSRKIESADVAEPFRQNVRAVAKNLAEEKRPLLVGFLSNQDQAAVKYAEWTAKAFQDDGIRFELRRVERLDLEDRLQEANEDPTVHGIMIYYPVFGNRPSFYGGNMDDYLRDSIDIRKDVEGLCHTYRHNLYHNKRTMDPAGKIKSILPCTPLAVVKILEHLQVYDQSLAEGFRLSGKTITIFNRSEIVGRPLAAMLANDGAEVYSVDISSIFLVKKGKIFETEDGAEQACKKSHVIITGVPTKDFRLDSSWVSPNTTVVNVASFKNVDEESLSKVPGVTYVPNVGKVTVSILERNILRLFEDYHKEY